MIENKIVTIRKRNTFDKGWSLVTPYQAGLSKNKHFRSLRVSDIVRAITKSTQVNLILSETCLSSQIVSELEWANQYIAINLIAKNQIIADRYAKLKFNKVDIDASIDFNYIAIKGNINLYVLVSEDYISVDKRLNDVYFEQAKADTDFDFLKNAKSVIFIDEDNNKNYDNLIKVCNSANVPTAFLVGVKAYNQTLVHEFINSPSKLLCSQNVKNGILYSTGDGRIYCANLTNKGVCVSVEIENADYYLGQAFESLKLPDTLSVSEIPHSSYVCQTDIVTPLKIAKEKVVNRTEYIKGMADFVSEQFDRSETDTHNQFCTEAEDVVYNFTLIPPLFETDKISSIYAGTEAVYAKWEELFNSINIVKAIRFLKDLQLGESGLCLMCDEIISFNKRLIKMVTQHNYRNYYAEIRAINELVNYANIDDYCKEIFVKLNAENSNTKFDKFDDEIAGYRQTIEEKKSLIEKGVEVLSNKRRVEILEKKIADLTAMKQRFSGSATIRDNKQLDAFLTTCKQVIKGEFVEEKREIDSIGNVLALKEATKIAKLEMFVKAYLYELNQFIISAKQIFNEFEGIDIPTDYVVYEQDEERVIAIECEQEYHNTKNIRKHFNLHCKARR